MHLRIVLMCLLGGFPLGAWSAPLPANQVFHFNLPAFNANTLSMHWTIQPGHFLYQSSISLETEQNKALQVGTIPFPTPVSKVSNLGKQFLIYRDSLSIAVPVSATTAGNLKVKVHYQGCSDAGFCYPPQSQALQLSFDSNHVLTKVHSIDDSADFAASPSYPSDPVPRIPVTGSSARSSAEVTTLLFSASPAWILLSFFGFGLLLAFTPCVLPMIPVLSSIIIGHSQPLSTRKAFLLSLSYVLSMSVTYGIVGAVIALLGENLQILLQSAWILGIFSLVLIALALSMFDVLNFRLPVAWQTGLAKLSRSHPGGHYLNAAIMGSLSILILSPCVTPALIGALTYIADQGSPYLGLTALFFLGLGMGTPLLLIGASAGKFLPKTGQWMNTIKSLFGILLLGMAIHLLERLVSATLSMLLWSALLISCGLSLKPLTAAPRGRLILQQALGIMCLVYGGLILYGASAGHTNPWLPLSNRFMDTTPQHRIVVKTVAQAQTILTEAASSQQPVMIDFYAKWCETCQYIEKNILQSTEISAYAHRVRMVQADLSNNDADSQALLKYFHVIAPPTFLFFDHAGNPIPDLQWVGSLETDTLLARLKKITT